MTTFKIAVIPGDGIGNETIPEGLKVLTRALDLSGESTQLEFKEFGPSAKRYKETGETLTDAELDELRSFDAIYFGAIGDPSVPSGILERGVIIRLRFELDHAINVRPARYFAGTATPLANPGDIDFLVVREGTEGAYAGQGGFLRKNTAHEVANEISVNTWYGIERAVRFAFEKARARKQKLTYVHKTNVMVHAGNLWERVVAHVARDFAEVAVTYEHADACTMYLVNDPGRYDVIVTDNLFGDIVSDLAAAVTGGIGLAASANLNVTGTGPSLFEPIHGSAPDIAGKGIADPTATILSAALMAENLGLDVVAKSIVTAVEEDISERGNTPRSTTDIGDAIAGRLSV